PAQMHELVVAEARKSPADKKQEPAEENHLGPKRGNLQEDDNRMRETPMGVPGEVKTVSLQIGDLPAPEKKSGRQGRNQDRLDEIGHEERAKLHAAVFHEIADDLRLPLGQIKRHAFRLGDSSHQKQHESQRLKHDSPFGKPSPQQFPLLPIQMRQVQSSKNHKQADQRGPHCDFVTDHLTGRAQAAEEGKLVIRGKAGQKVAVDAHRHHRENEEQPDVQRKNLQLDSSPPHLNRVAERNRGETHKRKKQRDQGRNRVQEFVSSGRNEVLFEEHFESVSENVKQPESPQAENRGAVGPDAILHYRRLFSLHPGEERRENQDRVDEDNRLDENDDDVNHSISDFGFRISDFGFRISD